MDIDKEKILGKLGITQLNAMQEASIAAFSENSNDIVLLSPTGSGKTLAYLLPLVGLLDHSNDNVQAVVIVPGRELALQSSNVFESMGTGFRSCACYGGRATMDEHRLLAKRKPHVVFATPGRLIDHLIKRNIEPSFVSYVVIDEFDKCLEMGFHEEMHSILGELHNVERRILLSATDAEQIPMFVNMGATTRVDFLVADEQISDRVNIYKVLSPDKDKLDTLAKLLLSLGNESSVIFLNYRDSVERTGKYLVERGFTISMFHGGLDQKAREDALYKFSNGSANILVCTDLAARGLDIPNINNIIHYHLPENEDGYVHRVGRTARWDATGRAFFILGPAEAIPSFIKDDIAEYAIPDDLPVPSQPLMATIYIGKGKKDKLSKGDILGFLCKKGGLNNSDIGRIDVKERFTYVAISRAKVSQTLKMTHGEKIKGIKTVVEVVR